MDEGKTEYGKLIAYAASDHKGKFLAFLSEDSKVISFYSNGETWEQNKELADG